MQSIIILCNKLDGKAGIILDKLLTFYSVFVRMIDSVRFNGVPIQSVCFASKHLNLVVNVKIKHRT